MFENPGQQTLIFTILFILPTLITLKIDRSNIGLTLDKSTQLKGLAILMVIFGHIGYFVSPTPQFLYPLSVLSGVGVNLFLILSGFGLSASASKTHSSIVSFYKKRLAKLFIPLWIFLILILIADKLILNRGYSLVEIIRSFLGFYPSANPRWDIDSPLWYFSLILFYYLIFPITFFKNRSYLTGILLLLLGGLAINLNLPVNNDSLTLYQLHFLAFPFGVILYYLQSQPFIQLILNKIPKLFYPLLGIISLSIFTYTAIHSSVGGFYLTEQLISLITSFCLIFFWILIPIRLSVIKLFGEYSYEIYLCHLPIIFRFNFLYKHLPAYLSTIIYLILLLILGKILRAMEDLFKNIIYYG